VADIKDMEKRFKELERRRDELVDALKLLRQRHERREVTDDDYQAKRYGIEREIVEVMDRLTQMRYLMESGYG